MRRDVEAMYKELMRTLIQFHNPTDYSGAMRHSVETGEKGQFRPATNTMLG